MHNPDTAERFFRGPVTGVLLSQEVLNSEDLCEACLTALATAACSQELLIAEPEFGCPPPCLAPVVQLGLGAAVGHRGQRRHLGLQLLHCIADSQERLLVTMHQSGKLSAEQVLRPLIEVVAADEVLVRGREEAFSSSVKTAAEWGYEYAVLDRLSRRLPDRLVLPTVYKLACRCLESDGGHPPEVTVRIQAAALAAMRAVLPGCAVTVRKHLHRVARLLLRGLAVPALHPVAFPLTADLCRAVPAETRCGSARLVDRLVPPLMQQLRHLTLRDEAFPHALTALEAACPAKSKGLPFRPQRLSEEATAWLCCKLEELLSSGQTILAGTKIDQWEVILLRLCSLLKLMVRGQPAGRSASGDPSGVCSLGQRVASALRKALTGAKSPEGRSAALEASGAWLRVAAEVSPVISRAHLELLQLSLMAAEAGLKAHGQDQGQERAVSAESSALFFATLGPAGQARLLPNGPSSSVVLAVGLERCTEAPSAGLLRALAALPAEKGSSFSGPSQEAGEALGRVAALLAKLLQDLDLRSATADLTRQLPRCEATAPVLAVLAEVLLREERPDTLTSLCIAAAQMVAQDDEGIAMGPAWSKAHEALKFSVDILQRRGGCCRLWTGQDSGTVDEDSSDDSAQTGSDSDESVMTVASTADLEASESGSLERAVTSLIQASGL